MKLYLSTNSPYARKVRVVSHELGILSRIELIETNPRDPSTGLWNLNPLAKVPVMQLRDGVILYDSPVICEFLDSEFGQGRLLGDGCDSWRVRTLAALADGMMDAAMAARLEGMRLREEQSPDWIKKQFSVVERGFEALERRADELEGRVDLGVIGAACAIAWIGFRHSQRDWLKGRQALADWYNRFSERTSMRETAPVAAT